MASSSKSDAKGFRIRRYLLLSKRLFLANLRRITLSLAVLAVLHRVYWLITLRLDPVNETNSDHFLGDQLHSGRVQGETIQECSGDQFFNQETTSSSSPSSCRFVPHSIPAIGKTDPRLKRPNDFCNQDELCAMQLERVCLTRRDLSPPHPTASSYQAGQPYLDVVGLGRDCAQVQGRAAMYGGRSCWHMGKRLPINMGGPLPEGGVLQPEGKRIIWKPKTFIVYCAQEGCDYNFFHSMGLAYYSTYVALQKLGLESLEGIHVEFYECLSGKPNEYKSPELIATARERHTVFMEAFRPASINFVDIELQNTSQHFGCYESVYFVGNEGWPWHCRTTDTSEDPMLAGFVNLVTEALGFDSKAALPETDRVLYFKRENTVRTLLNTKEVEAAFPVPYSIYAPGSSTQTYRERLKEIIGMTRNASIIFGMHGAGLTNVIFAAPDAVLIEVTNCYWRIPLYRNLAVLTGKNYLETVVAIDEGCKTLEENPEFMEHHGEHLTIPLNDFASIFDQARIILQRARSRQRHTTRTL